MDDFPIVFFMCTIFLPIIIWNSNDIYVAYCITCTVWFKINIISEEQTENRMVRYLCAVLIPISIEQNTHIVTIR